MSLVRCKDCGRHFERAADEAWKVRCIPCFKKSKRTEPAAIDSSWVDRALAAESKVTALQCQLYQQRETIQVLIAKQNVRPVSSLDRELAQRGLPSGLTKSKGGFHALEC